MDSKKNASIQTIALALEKDIQELQHRLREKRDLLNALGTICDHPNVEKYRDYQIGTCEFCLHEFMSPSDVDLLLSE
ncbi:MAG: hypothetical protein WC666_03575 [Candidatus Paceibacterota bacterium]|jgi:hypothetical protein